MRGRPQAASRPVEGAAAPSPDASAQAPLTPSLDTAATTPASAGSGGGGSSASAGQKRRRAPEQDVGTAEAVMRLATARTRTLLGQGAAAGSPLTPGAVKPSGLPSPVDASGSASATPSEAVDAASDDAGPALADFLARAARECAARAKELGLSGGPAPPKQQQQPRLYLHRTASQQKPEPAAGASEGGSNLMTGVPGP